MTEFDEMTARQAFYEQKLADNTLRTANAEKMAEIAKKDGDLLKARWFLKKADELKRQRAELMAQIDELFPVRGKHGGTF